MLAQHFDTLRVTYGGLIEEIAGTSVFPTLLRYFNAVILNDISERDSRKRHPEDPVIESVVVSYLTVELAKAVRIALATEAKKRHFPDAAMNAGEIEALGRELLTKEEELCKRFDEIWFLNAY